MKFANFRRNRLCSKSVLRKAIRIRPIDWKAVTDVMMVLALLTLAYAVVTDDGSGTVLIQMRDK